jgi:hypothetical protein
MSHGVNAARCLTQATEAALAGDYHKATALTGIAITHLMVAATPEPSASPKVERYPGFTTDGSDPEVVEEQLIHGRPARDFISPIPYIDYDTVLGYMAKHFPAELDMMDLTAEATMRDGWALKHACARVGRPVYKVEAPRFLREEGIQEVNCYPQEILAERFSA